MKTRASECTIYKDLIQNHVKNLKDSKQDSLLLVYKYQGCSQGALGARAPPFGKVREHFFGSTFLKKFQNFL